MRESRFPGLLPALIVVQLAAVLTYDYVDRISRPTIDRQVSLHTEIVSGDAPYEYRYRVLVPFAAEYLARSVEFLAGAYSGRPATRHYGVRSFGFAYASLQFVFLTIFFGCLYGLLATWYAPAWRCFGLAIAALAATITFRDHYFHPWSFCEMALFAAGLYLLYRHHFLGFTLVSLLGVFNRDTSVFLPLAALLLVIPTGTTPLRAYLARKDVRFAVGAGLVWLIGFLLLRAAVGYRPAAFTIARAVEANLERWPYALVLNGLLFGPLWLVMLRGWWMAPPFISRVAWIIVPYLGVLLVVGFWWEIRYWMTMLPVLTPLLVAGLGASPRSQS